MSESTIQVEGLDELRAALKQVDKEAPKDLAAEMQKISRHVADKARSLVPRVSGAAAGSIKTRKSQKGGRIAIGGSQAPYMPWLNFGGRVGRSKSIFRPPQDPDYFIYRTLAAESNNVRRMLSDVVERLGRRAGFEVD